MSSDSMAIIILFLSILVIPPKIKVTHALGLGLPLKTTSSDNNETIVGKKNNLLNSTFRLKAKYGSGRSEISGSSTAKSDPKLKTLTILGLFELTENGTKRSNGQSEKYAAEMAISDINRRQILKNYQLVLQTNDTQCDAGVGVDAFFHALYSNSDKIISLLGTACSEVTERLAKVVPYWNMVQPANYLLSELEKANVTCKATLTFSLSDLQDQLQDMKELDSRIIIASFGSDVAPQIFCEVYRLGMFGSEYVWILIGKPETSWWLSSSEPFNSHLTTATTLSSHKHAQNNNSAAPAASSSVVVVVGRNSNQSAVEIEKKLLINILQKNNTSSSSTGENINHNFYNFLNSTQKPKSHDQPPFPKPNVLVNKNNCSPEELSQVVEYALVVDRHNFIISNMSSISGMKASNFRAKFYRKKLQESPYAPETYDAVWSLALALKSVHERYNMSLESFEYNDTDFSTKLMEELSQLVFAGISGPVSFSGPDRIGVTSFMQIIGGEMKQVGLYFPHESYLQLNCSGCTQIHWVRNQVPIAKRDFRFKIIQVESSLYIIVATVAFAGILMAFGFLLFNLYNRKLKYIKLSSPRLNNIVIFGCIFAYMAVILLGSDWAEADLQHFDYMCTIRAYLLSTGFSLAFGGMFAKTYRVHRIFTRSCAGVVKNKLLKDRQLMTLILALFVIDCVIVSTWSICDPMYRNLQNLTMEIDPSDRSVVYQNQIEVCRSQQGHIWLSILYGYKGLLLVVGLYMAWETRHVKIQALNDSKYIGICVYIVVLTSVLAVSLVNLISERVTIAFLSVTTLILTSTTMTLCLLFLPKIHAIVNKSHVGDPVVESSGLKIEFNTRRFMIEDTKELQFRADVQNRVFKRQIELIDAEIWRAEKLLVEPKSGAIKASTTTTTNTSRKNSDSAFNVAAAAAQSSTSTSSKKHAVAVNPYPDSSSSSSSDENESSKSEIYTVYLHRPRFIIPIQLYNLGNCTAAGTSTAPTNNNNNNRMHVLSSIAAMATSALRASNQGQGQGQGLGQNPDNSRSSTNPPIPRSSWPAQAADSTNTNTSKKYRFSSEPRLLLETTDSLQLELTSTSLTVETPTTPTKAISTSCESFKYIPTDKPGSRKSSSTSNSSSKRQLLLNFLKSPISFVSGFVAAHSKNRDRAADDKHKHVCENTENSDRFKYSSVPNLWVVKSSPILGPEYSPRKHGSYSGMVGVGSGSHSRMMEAYSLVPHSSGRDVSPVDHERDPPDPVVTFSPTSEESVYL